MNGLLPRHKRDPYWLLLPTVALLAVFFFYPLVDAVRLSLHEWDLLTEPRYVGLGNYRALIESGELWHALVTTLTFSVVVVAGSMLLGLGLALALNRDTAFAAFVRGAVFSAYVISWVSVALLWLWVLDSDAGALTAILRSVGLPTKNWLGDPNIALYSLAGVTIWKIAGYSMVLFLAGLQDIPRALYEAAALDGAGKFARFWNVTWPLLRPTTAFVATTSLIVSFQVFDVVRVMTQGGPVKSTTVFVYAIYEQVFLNLRVGRASALVVVFFGLLLVLTALQLYAWRKKGAT
ncbi:MAG TPA: sugar ABC transporter permease [Polyangiaceae bacterium]|nr:sugar ABC transporter permease [Polyangiaceae bacterium]